MRLVGYLEGWWGEGEGFIEYLWKRTDQINDELNFDCIIIIILNFFLTSLREATWR